MDTQRHAQQQVADDTCSPDSTTLAPVRRLSALLPKVEQTLPRLGEIAPIDQALRGPIRQPSIAGPALPELFVPGVTVAYLDGLPLARYTILDQVYEMQKPDNEEVCESVRKTVDKRELKYVLKVLQQPIKARACGNGPRASSDRRPVDPPPVVQLKVFDITEEGEPKDVTVNYDSGFMLYASLEVARPIAHGRMQAPPHPPVLTGVAVASAAYLDRPMGPSGYFIFPDLSVRHEGWYRLKFSLFEAVKHEQDADFDRPFIDTPPRPDTPVDHQAMANRMDVSSTPFQVFSAKKFPGLNESTKVSRVLAEQGCRVRIRRDVRQRKRAANSKGKDESSGRATPEFHPSEQHTRTPSLDSQYQGVRRDSLDSRPSIAGPSRQHSLGSATLPSPSLLGHPPRPMGPPPTHPHRTNWDASAPHTHWTMSHPPSSQLLPPSSQLLSPIYNRTPAPKPSIGCYSLPSATSQKRSYSPTQYNDNNAMKHGARPDTFQPPSLSAPGPGELIEAGDDNDDDDDDDEGPFQYPSSRMSFRSAACWPVHTYKRNDETPLQSSSNIHDLLSRDS